MGLYTVITNYPAILHQSNMFKLFASISSKHGPQKSVFYQLLQTNFNLIPVHLQPDGLRKGQREPTDRRLHCTLSGPR